MLFKGRPSQEMFKARLPNRENAEALLSIEVNLGVLGGREPQILGWRVVGGSPGFLDILLYFLMYRNMR